MKFDSQFYDDNRFFILTDFDDALQEGIIVPLTNKIEELSGQRNAYIEIYISTDGGDADLCMHMVHLLELAQARDITVRTIVTKNAFSAGSILAITGTPGERYISSSGEHLIHFGMSDGMFKRTPLQVDRMAVRTKNWFNTMLQHYQKYSAVPDLEQHMQDDLFFIPAKKCIKWKLADKDMLLL